MLPRSIFAGMAASLLAAHTSANSQKIPISSTGVHTEVLYFVASDCAYSDRYFPEMNRLQHEFAGRGVVFRWIYPNQTEKLESIRAHQQQFGSSPANAALDQSGELTRMAKVHITPEAAVLVLGNDGRWTAVYHGRIDDRYVRIGLERPRAEHHDLENAIEAVLANKPVQPPGGSAVGCAIMGPG